MRIALFICIIISLASCGPEIYYQETFEVEELGWSYQDTLVFTPQIKETDRLNNIHLTVEHSPEYSYQNIYFKIKTVFPDSTIMEERLSVDLADGKGLWYGKCNSQSCHLKIYLLENFKFPEQGEYSFAISQVTRKELLPGVQSLKFELVESEG